MRRHVTFLKLCRLNNIHSYTAGICVVVWFLSIWYHNFALKAHIYFVISLAIFGVVRYPHDIHSTVAVLVHIYDANYFIPRTYVKSCTWQSGLHVAMYIRSVNVAFLFHAIRDSELSSWSDGWTPVWVWVHEWNHSDLHVHDFYSSNNGSEHLWESLMELFMLLIQISDSLTDV